MPSDWPTKRLNELGEVNRGRSRHRPRYATHLYGGAYPFIQTGDIKASNGRITSYQQTYSEAGLAQSRLWPTGTLCITIAANIAETGILSFPACFPDSVVGFVADESKCEVLFIEYMFRHLRRHIQHEASGSVQDNINLETLNRLEIPFPPLAEQRAIALVLGALDDKIALNRRMNETLEELAQSIFKSWFVDTTTTDLPEGWRFGKLGEMLSVIETGGRPKGGVSGITEGVPSVGAESIVGIGRFDYGKTKFVPREFFAAMNRGHVQDGDVLLYKDGGRPGEFEPHLTMVGDGFPFTEFCINEHVYRLRTEPNLPQSFLYFWLSSDSTMDEMRSRGTGVAIPGLNSTQVRELAVLIPKSDVLKEFDQKVSPLLRRIFANCNESRTLAALRDALLPKLLSGELRVPAK